MFSPGAPVSSINRTDRPISWREAFDEMMDDDDICFVLGHYAVSVLS
jgi:hypothetical protein